MKARSEGSSLEVADVFGSQIANRKQSEICDLKFLARGEDSAHRLRPEDLWLRVSLAKLG